MAMLNIEFQPIVANRNYGPQRSGVTLEPHSTSEPSEHVRI